MSEPSLPELEAERDRLYAQLSVVGDFRRGSVSENWRKCWKPNCACAQPGHRGHGPRWLWTRTVAGRGTRGRQLAAAEVEKVRGELDRYQEFAAEVEQLAAAAVRSLGGDAGGAGPEAAELAIRAAMTKVGGSLLAGLLAADAGYRGPAVDCGAGHLAEFVSYRDKTL